MTEGPTTYTIHVCGRCEHKKWVWDEQFGQEVPMCKKTGDELSFDEYDTYASKQCPFLKESHG